MIVAPLIPIRVCNRPEIGRNAVSALAAAPSLAPAAVAAAIAARALETLCRPGTLSSNAATPPAVVTPTLLPHAWVSQRALIAAGVDRLLAVGELATHAVAAFGPGGKHYADQDSLVRELNAVLERGTTVLVKGSRFMEMEHVVERLGKLRELTAGGR